MVDALVRTDRAAFVRQILCDEAVDMLADGATLDYVLSIMPDAVDNNIVVDVVSERVSQWLRRNLVPNTIDSTISMNYAYILPAVAKDKIRLLSNAFNNAESSGYKKHILRREESYYEFSDAVRELLLSEFRADLHPSDIVHINEAAAQLILLGPEFDELRWTVDTHERLLDIWDELGR